MNIALKSIIRLPNQSFPISFALIAKTKINVNETILQVLTTDLVTEATKSVVRTWRIVSFTVWVYELLSLTVSKIDHSFVYHHPPPPPHHQHHHYYH